jgi:hypothetical protein
MKTTKAIYLAIMMLFFTGSIFAQTGSVGINNDGSSPNSKAMLDVSSTTKGFLPPRMTFSEKIAITTPPAGLMVWCTNCGTSGELQIYNGTTWIVISTSIALSLPDAPTNVTATAGSVSATVTFTAPASDGGTPITSYTATSNPGNITGTLSQAGSGTITVMGLTIGTAYTFTVTATNANGTGAASAASNSVTPVAFAIGQGYGGGIIAYILKPADPGYIPGETHGLIAATTDQSTGIIWSIWSGTLVPGGTSLAIGSGLANTEKIIAQNGAGITYAAGLARAYNGGGFNDWYLPSWNELGELCWMSSNGFGGFAFTHYWSSSEYDWYRARAQLFPSGTSSYYDKDFPNPFVRAVRSF